jgi:peptide/nickel transport system substrate-binding protein
MRHIGWAWLVASSILLAWRAGAETRPQYGGTLHVAVREAPASLDPGDVKQTDSLARRNLLALIFETLVIVDERGRVHPGLAVDWHPESDDQRWIFRLRRGVTFHDGSPLTAAMAASSLRTANPSWKVFVEGELVVVECEPADPHLPAKLASTGNSIVKKDGGEKLSGTGPFHIEQWQAGKKLILAAEENHWRGRPFVDAIEIELGRNFHEQSVELELGKADLIEVPPEQGHGAGIDDKRMSSSQPMELLALVFNRAAGTPDEKMLRSALAHSVDRVSMRSVLLQSGQMTESILPNWMSGYGFTFLRDPDLKLARSEREQVRTAPGWTVGYDANDSLARVLVERIALNASDAGLVLRPTTAANADVRLVRIPLASSDPWIALESAADSLGITMQNGKTDSEEDLYEAERSLLRSERVIPLFHLPANYASSPALKGFRVAADGAWHLDEVWIGKDRP